MLQDIGIAEQQKVQKQGRDDHIKQVYKPPTYLFRYTRIMEKDPCRTSTVSGHRTTKTHEWRADYFRVQEAYTHR